MAETKRVLLKLSGEAFLGDQESGIDFSLLESLSAQLLEAHKAGYQLAIVVGAGNIWRYRDNTDSGIDRVSSDYMGMLATIMNSVALSSAINTAGVDARVMSAIHVPQLAEAYLKVKADHHLNKGRIVICAGGTGNPFFTTDSSSALRALELNCDMLLKGTNTDGVYDKDPNTNADAKKYESVSFDEVLEKDLKVMDGAAIALCRDGNLPIRVFSFGENGNLLKAIEGTIGTIVG
ncbi:MAG: UMP kinase [Candidatus Gracilibacteria bacterium]|nr:UMP kinase [Candidatus Gracilibacteria bacterium]